MEREEAIQVVRGLTETTYFDDRELEGLRTLIPELTESEDERIRKMCIAAVNIAASADGGLLHSEASECLSWLEEQKDKNCLACDQHLKGYLAGRKVTEEEKQKENPKSADSIPSDCVSDVKCEDRSPKHTDSFGTDIRDTPAYWRGWDDAMKQKEQEHPNGCFTCDEYKKGYEEGRRNGFTAGYNKAMKEVEQKEQKPWRVGENAYFTPDKETPIAEHEQKPVEWSEEDELMILTVIQTLETLGGRGTTGMQIDWLKSLRPLPHWKPSEEQMEALSETIAFMPDTFKTKCTLETFQNDLKKHM